MTDGLCENQLGGIQTLDEFSHCRIIMDRDMCWTRATSSRMQLTSWIWSGDGCGPARRLARLPLRISPRLITPDFPPLTEVF